MTDQRSVRERRGESSGESRDGARPSSRDAVAGVTTGLSNVPDSLANAILAGLNPMQGLYAVMLSQPVGSLATGSVFMNIATTGAMSLAVREALASFPPEERLGIVAMLTLVVAAVQLALGFLRAGTYMKFVSNGVMRGFLTGVSVNVILSQVPSFTGYESSLSTRVFRAVDTLLHPLRLDIATVLTGVIAVGLIVVLGRTRLGPLSILASIVTVTAGVYALASAGFAGFDEIALVGGLADISRSLPIPRLPDIRHLDAVLVPGLAIALIGLVQGAGVSKSTPNPDRTYPDVSRDFVGQGAANGLVAWFQGMPVGASVSATSLVVSSGASSRWANVWAGATVLAVILLFAPLVQLIPLSVLAAVLIVASVNAIRVSSILEVWHTGLGTRLVMLFTFIATLFAPIQYAVLLGAGLSFIQYVWRASSDVRVVGLLVSEDGTVREVDPPARLPSRSVTLLDVYGNLFFAGSEELRTSLPEPQRAESPLVVLRLRGRTYVGSTEIQLLRRYLADLEAAGGTLFITGVGPELADQFARTGFDMVIGQARLFPAEKTVYASSLKAQSAARSWIEAHCGGTREDGAEE